MVEKGTWKIPIGRKTSKIDALIPRALVGSIFDKNFRPTTPSFGLEYIKFPNSGTSLHKQVIFGGYLFGSYAINQLAISVPHLFSASHHVILFHVHVSQTRHYCRKRQRSRLLRPFSVLYSDFHLPKYLVSNLGLNSHGSLMERSTWNSQISGIHEER